MMQDSGYDLDQQQCNEEDAANVLNFLARRLGYANACAMPIVQDNHAVVQNIVFNSEAMSSFMFVGKMDSPDVLSFPVDMPIANMLKHIVANKPNLYVMNVNYPYGGMLVRVFKDNESLEQLLIIHNSINGMKSINNSEMKH